MLNRLRSTLLSATLRLADLLSGRPTMVGCHACDGPFRRIYLPTSDPACDDHSARISVDTQVIEFEMPFEPMTEQRFCVLLEAVGEGWLPQGARVMDLAVEEASC